MSKALGIFNIRSFRDESLKLCVLSNLDSCQHMSKLCQKFYVLTLKFPFPLDLNPGLGGCKRRNSSTETALVVCAVQHVGQFQRRLKKTQKNNKKKFCVLKVVSSLASFMNIIVSPYHIYLAFLPLVVCRIGSSSQLVPD